MLSIELPTCTRDYVISIRNLKRDDALTLSYLATRLGADMLGAQAGRRIGRDGFTVSWSTAHLPDFDAPPDIVVTGECTDRADDAATVLALGGCSATLARLAVRRDYAPAIEPAPDTDVDECFPAACCPALIPCLPGPDEPRVYTLGDRPYGSAEYIASLCNCPAAYVALGALCRAMGFVPVQLVQRLLSMTIGRTTPHMLCNCVEGAFRGYRQVGLRHADSERTASGC